MPDKYSIILPVRNGGNYLRLCVGSILGQTYPYFNLIILDNNSNDGSLQWLRGLKDPRIVIHESSQSLSIEQNWGRIKDVPKNEFMTMIGHDDLLSPHYLEEMDKLIRNHPHASLYQAHYSYIDKDGKITRICLPMDEIQKSHEFLACQMNRTIDSTGTGYIMRSNDYRELGGIPVNYPNLIFADYDLWIRMARKGYKATTARECFFYREHLSVSRITNGELYEQAFEQFVKLLVTLKSEEAFRQVIERYGKKMLLYFCESLSHRVLKTEITQRKIKVRDVVNKFMNYAAKLIPGQSFDPLSKPGIRYAVLLDQSAPTRSAFNFLNKLRSR